MSPFDNRAVRWAVQSPGGELAYVLIGYTSAPLGRAFSLTVAEPPKEA